MHLFRVASCVHTSDPLHLPDCYKRPTMIGRLLSHLIGNVGDDDESTEDTFEHLTELEEAGWIIVNLAGDTSPTTARQTRRRVTNYD